MEFSVVDVKEELQKALSQELQARGIPINVYKSDPQTTAEIPCIGMNRVEDSETDFAISDFGDADYEEETGIYYDRYTSYFQEAIEVRVWHTNADEREKVYQTVKAVLIALRPSLVQKGLVSCLIEGGRDECDPTGQYVPFPIYWASCLFSYKLPLQVVMNQKVESIEKVIDNSHVQAEVEWGDDKDE